MIVIATNNGGQYLPSLLQGLFETGEKICIVDTGSTDIEYRLYLERIQIDGVKVFFNPSGYDCGAYLRAFEEFPKEEYYFFLHDSMRVKDIRFVELAKKKDADLTAWLVFHPLPFHNGYDSPEQKNFIHHALGRSDLPEFGIFGSIFGATNEAMSKMVPYARRMIPSNKIQQQGNERGWAVLADMLGLKVESLEGEWTPQRIAADGYCLLTKILGNRQ